MLSAPLATHPPVADWVARIVGPWRFILIQSALLAAWIVLNVTAHAARWAPYPCMLLKLVLSFQAPTTRPAST